MATTDTNADQILVDKIKNSISAGDSFDQPLDTDERVLARITDGIYRQPSSALRELIANSYDADATEVSITTDAPRFGFIKVTDNGIGMTPEALANLVLHIGGSAKRTQRGPEIGVTLPNDPSRSVGGRLLIGKIGIGLFSVAQLTRQFTIITKTEGADHQLLAHVTLNRFDESELAKVDKHGRHRFHAGHARIWAERTPDNKGHGTTIQMKTLLPRVVHILQSRDIWSAIREESQTGGRKTRVAPRFHIGEVHPKDSSALVTEPNFPWKPNADPATRFKRLVEAVGRAWTLSTHYARLEHVLDNYFQALWTIGLSLPLEYIDRHPFEITSHYAEHFYILPRKRRAQQLEEFHLGPRQSVGRRLGLAIPNDDAKRFSVTIDGVRLFRPIKYSDYPATSQALQGPVMFCGTAEPDLSSIPPEQRGGPLSFSGYFFWTPRVIPQEHNGVLIRINGASGTLFDKSFLKYQVGERRLSQLVAEIFVHSGLDGALNIDRESFNTAHPHYQILANWVHNCLRLIRNTLKSLQSNALQKRRDESTQSEEEELNKLIDELIRRSTDYEPAEVPEVVVVDNDRELQAAVKKGKIALVRKEVFHSISNGAPEAWIESHAAAVARLLEAFGLLEGLERAEQAKVVGGIIQLFIKTK